MFQLEGNLKFVNVDMAYLKHLHEVCDEVFYKSTNYDNKPYLGILINNNGRKYVLPLTSAKEKHKSWKDSYPDRFLVYSSLFFLRFSPQSKCNTIIFHNDGFSHFDYGYA